ncbi:hypothetical protein IWX83_002592 [Flavobacterium sp. CG_9.1]|uniref:hypothetical protein n=1 Tax=Flavobacterium sp. CG_9.1 TaxID=2787728 RepID=UPI0018C9CF13|nr:hypothetical protein [Flavobacterium sp. CG_9.1]MBG6062791.1 hypothetical protein [Flavobacterium sp. CG_9.1]
MVSTAQKAVAKKYIPEWIKLDFFNDSNLKSDIQNRISPKIKTELINALNHIKGDNRDGGGVSFSEITLLAMAYFYSEIFKDKILDRYFTLNMVKGFLDADNQSNYSAIHEIDVEFFRLCDDPLFRHCWLIIQSAWFFNSEYFGHHQYIDYINHFIRTGDKLPIDNYKFDKIHLEGKYQELEKQKNTSIPLNEFKLVSDWYYGILFLVCKELKLPITHFNVVDKDNREFNPWTKTTKILRILAPFKIVECDIKSAFPTFLDIEVGSSLKDHVYNNLMVSKNITRGEAKILYNTYCNSGQYKSKEETIEFFLGCGYTNKQCIELIEMTHDPKTKFYSFMTEHESLAIQYFIVMNDLNRGTRLHDAIYLIDSGVKPQILIVPPNCDFGYTEINRPILLESFGLSNKRLPYAYISSIPQGLNMVSKYEGVKSGIKGQANGFIFYKEKYKYLNANFNLNDYTINYDTLCLRLEEMLSRLWYLNSKATKSNDLYSILKFIRANSQYVFNVRALYSRAVKFQFYSKHIFYKERNYGITKHLIFKKKIEFLAARNEAERTVNAMNNLKDFFYLLEERIRNNDYGYLDEIEIVGKRINNTIVYSMIRTFNLLVTGYQRKPRKRVSGDPLYSSVIKRVTLSGSTFNLKNQNAVAQRIILKYERELKVLNRLINNRVIAQQLFLILSEMVGVETDLNIIPHQEIQNKLKVDLMTIIEKNTALDIGIYISKFDALYLMKKSQIPVISNLNTIFDTDLANSIFNQISIEEASSRGEVFFKEYLSFHCIFQS